MSLFKSCLILVLFFLLLLLLFLLLLLYHSFHRRAPRARFLHLLYHHNIVRLFCDAGLCCN